MKELYQTLDPDEWVGWMAYYQLEPFGSPADDDRHRAICSLTYAINSKKGSDIPYFFDRDPKPKPETTFEEDIEAFYRSRGVIIEDESTK